MEEFIDFMSYKATAIVVLVFFMALLLSDKN